MVGPHFGGFAFSLVVSLLIVYTWFTFTRRPLPVPEVLLLVPVFGSGPGFSRSVITSGLSGAALGRGPRSNCTQLQVILTLWKKKTGSHELGVIHELGVMKHE